MSGIDNSESAAKKPAWQMAGRFGPTITTSADNTLREQLHQEIENKSKSCSNPTYDCSIPRIDGFEYCIRHILREPRGQYRQCSYIYVNGRKCLNAVLQHEVIKDQVLTTLCFEHSRLEQLKKTRATFGKLRYIETNEVLLNNLAHHVNVAEPIKDIKMQNDEQLIDVVSPQIKAFIPHVDIYSLKDIMKPKEIKTRVLDFASDSSDEDTEATRINNLWMECDESDDESMGSDNDEVEALDHANIYTHEEALRISINKMTKLQSLYKSQINHLHYTLKDRRRAYLQELRKERELHCSIHDQLKDSPNERHMYTKLKMLGSYHRRHGAEAVLYKKFKEKRARNFGTYIQKAPLFPKCVFTEGGVKCGERTIPCSKYCPKHILEDKKQTLFRACKVEKSNVVCHEPVPCIGENSNCLLHFAMPPKIQYSQKKNDSETEDEHETTKLEKIDENISTNVVQSVKKIDQLSTTTTTTISSSILKNPKRKSRKSLVPIKSDMRTNVITSKMTNTTTTNSVQVAAATTTTPKTQANDEKSCIMAPPKVTINTATITTTTTTAAAATITTPSLNLRTKKRLQQKPITKQQQQQYQQSLTSNNKSKKNNNNRKSLRRGKNNNDILKSIMKIETEKDNKNVILESTSNKLTVPKVNVISQIQPKPQIKQILSPEQQQQHQIINQLVQKQEIIQKQMQKQQVQQQQPQIFQIQKQEVQVQNTDKMKISSSTSSSVSSLAATTTTTATTPKILLIPVQQTADQHQPQQQQQQQQQPSNDSEQRKELQLKQLQQQLKQHNLQQKLPQTIKIVPIPKVMIGQQQQPQHQQQQQTIKVSGSPYIIKRKLPYQPVQNMIGGRAPAAAASESVHILTNAIPQLRFPGLPKSTSVTLNKVMIKTSESALSTTTTTTGSTITPLTTTTTATASSSSSSTSNKLQVQIKPIIMSTKQQSAMKNLDNVRTTITTPTATTIRTSNLIRESPHQIQQKQQEPVQTISLQKLPKISQNVSQQLQNLKLHSNLQIQTKVVPAIQMSDKPHHYNQQLQQQQQQQREVDEVVREQAATTNVNVKVLQVGNDLTTIRQLLQQLQPQQQQSQHLQQLQQLQEQQQQQLQQRQVQTIEQEQKILHPNNYIKLNVGSASRVITPTFATINQNNNNNNNTSFNYKNNNDNDNDNSSSFVNNLNIYNNRQNIKTPINNRGFVNAVTLTPNNSKVSTSTANISLSSVTASAATPATVTTGTSSLLLSLSSSSPPSNIPSISKITTNADSINILNSSQLRYLSKYNTVIVPTTTSTTTIQTKNVSSIISTATTISPSTTSTSLNRNIETKSIYNTTSLSAGKTPAARQRNSKAQGTQRTGGPVMMMVNKTTLPTGTSSAAVSVGTITLQTTGSYTSTSNTISIQSTPAQAVTTTSTTSAVVPIPILSKRRYPIMTPKNSNIIKTNLNQNPVKKKI